MNPGKDAFILGHTDLLAWLDRLAKDFALFGPVQKKRGETVFERVEDTRKLHLDYKTTMTSPRRFVYPSRQDIFRFDRVNGQIQEKTTEETGRIVIGIHPCDMRAISILDKTFLGDPSDSHYRRQRENTVILVLNCLRACDTAYPFHTLRAFCASMEAGPFLRPETNADIELTFLQNKETGTIAGSDCLVEPRSPAGAKIVAAAKNLKAASGETAAKKEKLEKISRASMAKTFATSGLPELLAKNLAHPVYKNVADTRCLNCSNCTMVCPTCYCYDIEDETSFDLGTTDRKRRWDSCLELRFAQVHGGNFRLSRKARLRQFVTHKLCNWIEQYGCFGCVGCGRCMTWCPTHIDLTEISEEIRQGNGKPK